MINIGKLNDLKVKGEDANHHYLTSCLIMTASDLSDQVTNPLFWNIFSILCHMFVAHIDIPQFY